MSAEPLFTSPLGTLKVLMQCLLGSVGLIVVIGAAIYVVVHIGHIGLAE